MKESILEEYSRIKQEYQNYKNLRKKLGLKSQTYMNLNEMQIKLKLSYKEEE